MNDKKLSNTTPTGWKFYTVTIVQVWVVFSIVTFVFGLYLTHLGVDHLIVTIVMALLYIFVIVCCIKRLVERLPVAALMLLVPIAPLAVLLLILSILPILQQLQ